MKYAFLVACREYVENIKTKGFWISILFFPIVLMLMMQVPGWLEKKGTPIRHFVLIDQSGQFERVVDESLARLHRKQVLDALREHAIIYAQPVPSAARATSPANGSGGTQDPIKTLLEKNADQAVDEILAQLKPFLDPNAPDFIPPRPRFERVPLPDSFDRTQSLDQLADALKPFLSGAQTLRVSGRDLSLYAAILIPREVIPQPVDPPNTQKARTSDPIQYWSANLADQSLRSEIELSIQKEIRQREYLRRGLNLRAVEEIESTRVAFASFNPKKEKGAETVGRVDVIRQWAPTGFVYVLWIAIFSIAQMLLNNTIEEKSNRVIEVLLSSVTAGELMMGKLAGIAAVGLTMVGSWIFTLGAILLWKVGGQSDFANQLLVVINTSNLIPAFIFYFLVGYIMYAGIILAIGSMCNTLKEAQNYMALITMIMMVPLMTMAFIPRDPNGTLATVLSWIPIYTPFVMLNRAMADPPLFDLIGTMILLLIFTTFVLWCSVKIFRIGILRTGQPPRIIEIWHWLKG